MILSLLICSIYERAGMLSALLRELNKQIEENNAADKVEILVELDNKGCMPTGTKRNILYQKAKGKYSLSIDEDDEIPDYFIFELLLAAESGSDCFATNGIMTTNGGNEKKWFIALGNPYCAVNENGKEVYLRYPNHLTPIKTEIAKSVLFPEIFIGEDYQWATELHNKGLIKTQYVIEKPMYHYKFISGKK